MHEKKLKTLYDICEALTTELEEVAKKTRDGMSAGDLDLIDKLTHALKSTKTTIAMMEEEGEDEGYSGWYPRYYYAGGGGSSRAGGSYEGGSSRAYEGGSSRAGGYSQRRGRNRDSMGRFTRGRSYAYAYDDGGEEAIEQIRGMLDQLPDDKRREIEQALDR